MKQEFEMVKEDLEALLDACRPVPLIAIHCGPIPSQQERANVAWKQLGEKMGFDFMTVERVPGKGPEFFKAEPMG